MNLFYRRAAHIDRPVLNPPVINLRPHGRIEIPVPHGFHDSRTAFFPGIDRNPSAKAVALLRFPVGIVAGDAEHPPPLPQEHVPVHVRPPGMTDALAAHVEYLNGLISRQTADLLSFHPGKYRVRQNHELAVGPHAVRQLLDRHLRGVRPLHGKSFLLSRRAAGKPYQVNAFGFRVGDVPFPPRYQANPFQFLLKGIHNVVVRNRQKIIAPVPIIPDLPGRFTHAVGNRGMAMDISLQPHPPIFKKRMFHLITRSIVLSLHLLLYLSGPQKTTRLRQPAPPD